MWPKVGHRGMETQISGHISVHRKQYHGMWCNRHSIYPICMHKHPQIDSWVNLWCSGNFQKFRIFIMKLCMFWHVLAKIWTPCRRTSMKLGVLSFLIDLKVYGRWYVALLINPWKWLSKVVYVTVVFWIPGFAVLAVTESALHPIKVPYEPKCHCSFIRDTVFDISTIFNFHHFPL